GGSLACESTTVGVGGCGLDDTIKINDRTYRRGNTRGVTANHADIHNAALKEGRFISEQDDLNRRSVMVIGVNAAQALFPDKQEGMVGTRVKMGGYVWEIIGVLAKRQTTVFGENEEDNAAFVPFRTGLQIAPGRKYLLLVMRATSAPLREAGNEVEAILGTPRNVTFPD